MPNAPVLRQLRLLPIYAFFLITFGLASFDKLRQIRAPDWFEKQFAGTILNAFPGALSVQFTALGVLEGFVALGLLASLARGEFRDARPRPLLGASLLLAQLVFVMLTFGQRLTGDFRGAADLGIYFGVALLASREAGR